jgi:hypothetical protein
MKAKSIIILSLVLFTTTACSHRIYGTVLPQADGSYKAIGSAKKEPEAFKIVESDAKTTCKKEGYYNFYSIDQTSKYVGPKLTDGNEKGMKGLALKLAEAAAKNNTQYNYTVEMVFKCR